MEELCKLLYARQIRLNSFMASIFTTTAVAKAMKIKQRVLNIATS